MQDGERGIIVANQNGLGDLEFQPARGKAGGRKRTRDLHCQGLALELDRGNVHRELDMVRPGRGLGTSRRQDPFAELVDQAGLFRNGNELGGRDHAAFGMVPAQQRFAAGDPVVAEIDQGLIEKLEPSLRDRLTQIQLQCAARLDPRVHLRLKEAIGPASFGFGAIHRQIGILQQLIEIGAVLRSQRNADAGVGGELVTQTLVRFPDRLVNLRHQVGDIR
jgi:hypothetical protein